MYRLYYILLTLASPSPGSVAVACPTRPAVATSPWFSAQTATERCRAGRTARPSALHLKVRAQMRAPDRDGDPAHAHAHPKSE